MTRALPGQRAPSALEELCITELGQGTDVVSTLLVLDPTDSVLTRQTPMQALCFLCCLLDPSWAWAQLLKELSGQFS